MKKCKDCKEYACTKRLENSNCFFEEMYDYVEKEEKELYWEHFRVEAAKDILCAIISHFGTKDIDMDDVVKWTDSLISKLKAKDGK